MLKPRQRIPDLGDESICIFGEAAIGASECGAPYFCLYFFDASSKFSLSDEASFWNLRSPFTGRCTLAGN